MDKQNSARLLSETFNNDFNTDNFIRFVKELFNKISIRSRDCTQFIAKEYDDYISEVVKLGEYKDKNKNTIEILTVKLKKSSSIDRARTMQRNFIANWLGKFDKSAALVAFYGDDEDWRFSFVKMEYNLNSGESGKSVLTKELTPAKRYSFLVGKNEPNHTCQRQFIDLLIEEESNPLLDEIEDAFSIEKVTKEFFEKYNNLYVELEKSLRKLLNTDKNLKTEFDEKSISTVDFSKKLLGQIVFLYFLQKKGWLGVQKDTKGKLMSWGTGPKNFMKKLFNKEIINYKNFFNDILELLFYDALATDRDDDFYPHFDCKIPFLNGGLFEPINEYNWRETKLFLDNDLFKNIFDTFDQFNFTVKEDEPLEKEVAVDPEMLGKVFENLLEIKDRKSKGAFYTPREIVHYMCQQSLINYLETNTPLPKEDAEKFIQLGELALAQTIREQEVIKKYGKITSTNDKYTIPKTIKENHSVIDNALKEIKIVDPACGSGAFLLGMMNEIVKARSLLSIFVNDERKTYDLKREAIENCLYGVDIEPSAVEITKLRFWLSLIVDEQDIKNIKPLPNLDNKIMCGNSLLEEFEGVKLFDERLLGNFEKVKNRQYDLNESVGAIIKKSKNKLAELKKFQKEYFNQQDKKIKKQLREDIDRIEWELIEETLKEQGNEKAMKRLKQYKSNKMKPFFLWKLYFSEVFQRENPGFDVVIANPPYVEHKKLKEFSRIFQKNFDTYSGTADIYVYFYEKSFNLTRKNGCVTFITSNKFMKTSYGTALRKYLIEKNIQEIIDFTDFHIFEALVASSVIILINNKKYDNKIKITFIREDFTIKESLVNYIDKHNFEFIQSELTEDIWKLENEKILELKDKIDLIGTKIKDLKNVNVYRGVTTGFNPAFVINSNEVKEFVRNDVKYKYVIKPLLQGRHIRKWVYKKNDEYLIFIPWHFPLHNDLSISGSSMKAEEKFKNEFPYLYNHLSKFKNQLLHRNKDETGIRYEWYSLQRCANTYYEHFEREKIIWGLTADKWAFAYDKCGYFLPSNGYILTSGNIPIKLILAQLNSKISRFYFGIIGIMTAGGAYTLKHETIAELPISYKNETTNNKLIKLVDQIFSIVKDPNYSEDQDKKSRVGKIEEEIDIILFRFYELTQDEIKIIEDFLKGGK